MALDLSNDELLTTTRSVRKRLDFDRPVSRELLMECLDIALQAPSGSNAQGWQWIFVDDPDTKKALADIYRSNATGYLQLAPPERGDIRDQQQAAVRDSASYLNENFEKAPVLMIPCLEGRPDRAEAGMQASYWGSLLPAVWSFMLAARARGLGTCWTTLHLAFEQEAAELLGIPYDQVTQALLTPLAYTKGTDFKPGDRKSHDGIVHWDTW